MKKIDMIQTMINEGYINVEDYSKHYKTNKVEHAIHHLQYHVVKKQIEEMYDRYLTYKRTCATM